MKEKSNLTWLEALRAVGFTYNRRNRFDNRIFIISEFRKRGYISSSQELLLLVLELLAQYERDKGRPATPSDILACALGPEFLATI